MSEDLKFNNFAVIRTEILLNPDIDANRKILLAMLSSLSTQKGYCYASNQYLAESFRYRKGDNIVTKDPKTISSYLKDLEDLGLIKREGPGNGARRIYVNHGSDIEFTATTSQPKANKKKEPAVDWDKLMAFYEANRGGLGKITTFNPKRKKAVLSAIKEYADVEYTGPEIDGFVKPGDIISGKKAVQIVIVLAGQSEFLSENANKWANFDWIMRTDRFAEILEGGHQKSFKQTRPTKGPSNAVVPVENYDEDIIE